MACIEALVSGGFRDNDRVLDASICVLRSGRIRGLIRSQRRMQDYRVRSNAILGLTPYRRTEGAGRDPVD